MGEQKQCRFGGITKPNSNCTTPGPDGLPVQCVGDWARDKHAYLSRYIEATWGVRKNYVPSGPKKGGAAFIDLFAGPGKARIRDTGEIIDGSPLIALEHDRAPFSRLILCELDEENVAALGLRVVDGANRVRIVAGDCNAEIRQVVGLVPKYGLNVALIDPFGAKALRWSSIAALGRFKRMDMLIHFPTGAIKRNFKASGFGGVLDDLLGGSEWRDDVHTEHDVGKLIGHLRSRLATIGYDDQSVRDMPITTSGNLLLYHLVFASKHPKGSEIWQSITRIDSKGQRGLDL